jgi:hypothetical protein
MRVPSRIGVILAFTFLTVVAAPMPRALGRPTPKPGDGQAPNHFECTPTQLRKIRGPGRRHLCQFGNARRLQ